MVYPKLMAKTRSGSRQKNKDKYPHLFMVGIILYSSRIGWVVVNLAGFGLEPKGEGFALDI